MPFTSSSSKVGNTGPTVANIDLTIYWPLMAADQEDVAADSRTYYLYPYEFTVSLCVCVCGACVDKTSLCLRM